MRLTDGVVVLRAWSPADVDAVVRITRDPEIRRWTRVPDDNTPELVRTQLLSDRGEEAHLAVADAVTDAVVGAVGLIRPHEYGRAEIGYWVASERRREGIAARAVSLLADWAFAERGLHRLELHIDPANAASRGVAERAGFVLEGVLRDYEEIKGRRADVAMYARIASRS